MSTDNRMVELLADMLLKLDKLDAVVEEMREVKREQHRTTNAVWELSQMMQKVVAEPLALHASEISHIKERLDRLEQSH